MLHNVSNIKLVPLLGEKRLSRWAFLMQIAYPSQTGHSSAPGELLIEKEHRVNRAGV
jgi:hypothetical protein